MACNLFALCFLAIVPLHLAKCECKKARDITKMPMAASNTYNYAEGDKAYELADDWGSYCSSWEANESSIAFSEPMGCNEGMRDLAGHWCNDLWCYVSGCDCKDNFAMETMMWDGVKGLYFSYDLCCTMKKTEEECIEKGSQCKWGATKQQCRSREGDAEHEPKHPGMKWDAVEDKEEDEHDPELDDESTSRTTTPRVKVKEDTKKLKASLAALKSLPEDMQDAATIKDLEDRIGGGGKEVKKLKASLKALTSLPADMQDAAAITDLEDRLDAFKGHQEL